MIRFITLSLPVFVGNDFVAVFAKTLRKYHFAYINFVVLIVRSVKVVNETFIYMRIFYLGTFLNASDRFPFHYQRIILNSN